MTDDDARDLLYVVRSILRTYERNYGSFRHSAEQDNAGKMFERLFQKYFTESPGGYPDYEPRMEDGESAASVVKKFVAASEEGHAKIAAFMRKP